MTRSVGFLLFVLAYVADARADNRLTLIDNSPSLSQVIDINDHGHLVGMKDVVVPIGFAQQAFYWNGDREIPLAQGLGYTNVYPTALANNGFVVGYASRTIGDARGSMEACLWNTREDVFVGLGRLDSHLSSHAFDISGDGAVVVGYSAGRDPATMVPVVWQQQAEQWKCERLPVIHDYNPYLLMGRVVVSGDGRYVAACITVRVIARSPVPRYESSTFLWQRDANGGWRRNKLSDHQLRLADINNAGILVGSCLIEDRRRAFVITPERQFQVLEPLGADDNAGATDINNAGTVVGYSDDPDVGPRAFVWENGVVAALQIPGSPIVSWATSINERGDIAGYVTPLPSQNGTSGDSADIEKTISFVLAHSSSRGSESRRQAASE